MSERIYCLGGPGDGKFFDYHGGEFKLGIFKNPLPRMLAVKEGEPFPEAKEFVTEVYYGFTNERLATGEMIFAPQRRTVIQP